MNTQSDLNSIDDFLDEIIKENSAAINVAAAVLPTELEPSQESMSVVAPCQPDSAPSPVVQKIEGTVTKVHKKTKLKKCLEHIEKTAVAEPRKKRAYVRKKKVENGLENKVAMRPSEIHLKPPTEVQSKEQMIRELKDTHRPLEMLKTLSSLNYISSDVLRNTLLQSPSKSSGSGNALPLAASPLATRMINSSVKIKTVEVNVILPSKEEPMKTLNTFELVPIETSEHMKGLTETELLPIEIPEQMKTQSEAHLLPIEIPKKKAPRKPAKKKIKEEPGLAEESRPEVNQKLSDPCKPKRQPRKKKAIVVKEEAGHETLTAIDLNPMGIENLEIETKVAIKKKRQTKKKEITDVRASAESKPEKPRKKKTTEVVENLEIPHDENKQ